MALSLVTNDKQPQQFAIIGHLFEIAEHEQRTYRSFDGGQSLELLQELLALVGKDKDDTVEFPFPATPEPFPCSYSES